MDTPPRVRLWRGGALLLAVLSGLLLALCYPRFDIESLVWLWAAPLMVVLWWWPVREGRNRFWRGAALGYLSGVTFFAITFSWIREVTGVGAVLLPLYLALYVALWAGLAATVGRPRDRFLGSEPRPETKPAFLRASTHALSCAFFNGAAWAGLEWLRGWVFTGFGWNGLGVAFHQNLNLMQVADLVGVTGLAFLPMFTSCVLVTTVRRFQLEIRHQRLRPHLDFGLALALVVATFLYGLNRVLSPQAPGKELRCVIVQLAIPQSEKWDPAHAERILGEFAGYTTTYVEATDPDFVIWPESSLQSSLFEDPFNERFLNSLLARGNFALMLGANDFDVAAGKFYNGAALMAGEFDSPEMQIYHKIHLVPFGEFIPFREQVPLLDRWLGELIPGDFNRGDSTEALAFPGDDFKVIPLICFEDTVGRLARRFVRDEPQIMVNVTNDGWFGQSPAAEQHLANARFRCVELRRPMARACNTGVTCLIDERGRTTAILDDPDEGIFVKGALASTLRVPLDGGVTFYARFGDWFVAMLGGVVAFMLGTYPWRRRALDS